MAKTPDYSHDDVLETIDWCIEQFEDRIHMYSDPTYSGGYHELNDVDAMLATTFKKRLRIMRDLRHKVESVPEGKRG